MISAVIPIIIPIHSFGTTSLSLSGFLLICTICTCVLFVIIGWASGSHDAWLINILKGKPDPITRGARWNPFYRLGYSIGRFLGETNAR